MMACESSSNLVCVFVVDCDGAVGVDVGQSSHLDLLLAPVTMLASLSCCCLLLLRICFSLACCFDAIFACLSMLKKVQF